MTHGGEDMLAVEVHHRALENITNEMAIALVRTSGSPVVTESKDFAACLLDTIPEHLSAAAVLVTHFGTSLIGTRRVSELVRERDVRPGDGWIVNDSYAGGANHQGDVGIIMPLFRGADHLGWGFANMHVLDIGGTGVSGVAPTARDVYGEGLRFDGVRAIREGAIDPEWEDFIATNVRLSGPVLNDIRSMISGINVGNRKLGELVGALGAERHRRLCEINKDLTESVLRERIGLLPDGRYEAHEWNEYDGHGPDLLQQISVTLEVRDSDLHFTFRGAPQIDGFVNAGYGALLGSMFVAVLTGLCYGDMPLNGGLWRPVTVDVGEPGTVVNPTPPAPVSMGHSEVGMRVRKLARDVLCQAMALSSDPVIRARVAGKAHDGPAMGPILFGGNQHGTRSVIVYQETALTGGGAASVQDGQDAYGSSGMTGSGLPDLETHEAADPVRFLWRTVARNSGGPGITRGGQGVAQSWRMEFIDRMAGPSTLACAEVPATGFGGGFPGGGDVCWVLSGEDAERVIGRHGEEDVYEFLRDLRPLAGKLGFIEVRRGDVMVIAGGGGGGLGDPLLRDPALVAADVRGAYITEAHAEAAYGVCLGASGGVDLTATHALREQIRHDRVGGEPRRPMRPPRDIGVSVLVDGADWACGSCGERLAPRGENFRSGVIVREGEVGARLRELDMYARTRTAEPEVVMREHYCPACAHSLVVDVVTADTPVVAAPALAAMQPAV
jgi:N-methylhydantoinase B